LTPSQFLQISGKECQKQLAQTSGTYSSGNCSGITPDSHLIPYIALHTILETIAGTKVLFFI
jgi:hypothetical protein